MKAILIGALLSLSLTAFANLDELLGTYKPTSGEGEATVTKVLVSEATLFEPAKYEYRVDLWKSHHSLSNSTALEIGEDGKSLVSSGGNECDDPGCFYFDNIEIVIKRPTPRSRPQIKVEYEGHHNDDGDSGYYDFTGSATFTKTR